MLMEDDLPSPKLSSENPAEWTLADCQILANQAGEMMRREHGKRKGIGAAGQLGPQEKSDSAKSDCPGSSSRYGDLNSHVAFYWRFISSTGRWERAFVEQIQSGDGAGI